MRRNIDGCSENDLEKNREERERRGEQRRRRTEKRVLYFL
jgi:hypothetical protein